MTRTEVLRHAETAVADREKRYGHPADHFDKVAMLWGEAFGWAVQAKHVPLALALLKIAREVNAHTDDNLIDLAGYAALAGEVS